MHISLDAKQQIDALTVCVKVLFCNAELSENGSQPSFLELEDRIVVDFQDDQQDNYIIGEVADNAST